MAHGRHPSERSIQTYYTNVLYVCMIPAMADVATGNRTRQNQRILISGASVAGPSLAWWLARHGFRPTVVERAPQLRGGGYAVDFRGPAHLSVLAKMGILDQVRSEERRVGIERRVIWLLDSMW